MEPADAPGLPARALAALQCPVCRGELRARAGAVTCPEGHTFDVAREGYVNLLAGRVPASSGDTAAMVAARGRFLGAGHYAPIVAGVAEIAARTLRNEPAGCVLEVGAGTGYWLAQLLQRAAEQKFAEAAAASLSALAVDVSKAAARRAARAHPLMLSIVADAGALPVRSSAVALALSVCAPRDARELARVLASGAALITVLPTAAHLQEIVPRIGLLTVGDEKLPRLQERLGGDFALVDTAPVATDLILSRRDVADLVLMGPNAFHLTEADVHARAATLPDPVGATASFEIVEWRRRAR